MARNPEVNVIFAIKFRVAFSPRAVSAGMSRADGALQAGL